MKKKYLFLLLCIPLLMTGCKQIPKLEDGKEIVVELEGKQISAEEFFEELKKEDGANVLVNMVDSYIVDKEVTDEMKEAAKTMAKAEYDQMYLYYKDNWDSFLSNYGFNNDDELIQVIEDNYLKQLVLEKYVKENVITEDEINDYYEKNIYGENTVRHILIIPEVNDEMTDEEKTNAKNEALEEAKQLIQELNNSTNLEEDFKALAIEKSDDTGSASQGGLIENFTNESGLVEEFWQASLKLKVGELTQNPVETQYGYHIIYKVSQKEKPELNLVKDKILDTLVNEILSGSDSAFQVYFAGLREKYYLTIYDDTIKNVYDSKRK